MRCWQDPGAAETLSLGPFGYFSTELTSRIVFPCQGVCTTVVSTRNQTEAMASTHPTFHWGSSSRYPQTRSAPPVRLPRLAQKCVRGPNATGVLDDSPRALGCCRGPSKRGKKSPSAVYADARMAQGLGHSQDGAVRVGSSQEKPACRRASPVSSCLTPDSTNHTVQRAGLPRIGETAGFGRPTNDMVSVEASACTL